MADERRAAKDAWRAVDEAAAARAHRGDVEVVDDRRELGFSLAEIVALQPVLQTPGSAEHLRDALRTKARSVERRMERLARLRVAILARADADCPLYRALTARLTA